MVLITFQTTFGKIYSGDDDEKRMQIYFRNKDFIYDYNILNLKGITSQSLRLNQYGEMVFLALIKYFYLLLYFVYLSL